MKSEVVQIGGYPGGSDPKKAWMQKALRSTAEELRELAGSIESLADSPGPDMAHWYAECVRVVASGEPLILSARDNLISAACMREPDRVPIMRIARVAGMNVNTVRNRLRRGQYSHDQQDRSADPNPF